MHYEGTVIRPPSEAFSIILQVTTGCSHNRCTFCGAYRDKPFSLKTDKQIAEDIKFAAAYCKRQKTLFLADGNVLVLPQKKLSAILKNIRKRLPFVRRVSSYANCRDILAKSDRDLRELFELGLSRIYMGLESGHDDTLLRIDKGS
ncbi:MAG: radical SAM protein, partial [Desulfobulbaceae bacterium]|nr:radical SAM protein [Desulfobulbaceae bacterium]